MLRGGFRIHRANALLAIATAELPTAELADRLRANAANPFRPPIVGHPGQLTDLQVHGQDIRRPLGRPATLTPDRLQASLTFLTGGRAVGFTPRRRLTGLTFKATDLDWSWTAPAKSTPALVSGPAEALMMALTGRPSALTDLSGPGLPLLAARLR